jgi:general nucleoside transport system ATP-binding protein
VHGAWIDVPDEDLMWVGASSAVSVLQPDAQVTGSSAGTEAPPATSSAQTVVARNVSKRFGRLAALTDVTVSFRFGEIHGLVGQNGAGKTTLASVLFGLYEPSEGSVVVRGKSVRMRSPRQALSLGICMVQQRFSLARELTVAENVMLGERLAGLGLRARQREWEERVEALAATCGLVIDPRARVAELPYSVQQRVAILRALGTDSDLLILDEPTTNLTPQQVRELFELLATLRDAGKGILLITHKIREVLEATSRITVLQAGRVMVELETARADYVTIAEAMVGRPSVERVRSLRAPARNRPALELRGVVLPSDAEEKPVIDLRVDRGEILGVAGVAGNGQTELAEVISGMRSPLAGEILVDGKPITPLGAAERAAQGLGYVPEDRHRVGTTPDLTLAEALALKALRRPQTSRWGLLRRQAMFQHAVQGIARFGIVPPDPQARVHELSGGNLQKLLLARELGLATTLLVAAQPTQGLDIAARDFAHDQLEQRAAEGMAVLLLSTELEEILALSHRAAVLYRFGIIGVVDGDDLNAQRLGYLMGGRAAGDHE